MPYRMKLRTLDGAATGLSDYGMSVINLKFAEHLRVNIYKGIEIEC